AVLLLCAVLASIAILGYWVSPSLAPLMFWSDPIILEFLAGMLIAVAYRHGIFIPIMLRICLIIVAIFTIWSVPEFMPPSGYRFLAWGVPAAVVVACGVLGRRSVPVRWLATPVKLLGDASYALYLIHPLTGSIVLILWPKGLYHYPMMPVILISVVL